MIFIYGLKALYVTKWYCKLSNIASCPCCIFILLPFLPHPIHLFRIIYTCSFIMESQADYNQADGFLEPPKQKSMLTITTDLPITYPIRTVLVHRCILQCLWVRCALPINSRSSSVATVYLVPLYWEGAASAVVVDAPHPSRRLRHLSSGSAVRGARGLR